MDPRCFYQTQSEHAIPLVLMNTPRFLQELPNLIPSLRNALVAQQFRGALGDVALIYAADGKPSTIYIGGGENVTDAMAIASVAARLPEGSFVISEALSNQAKVVWSLAQYQFDKYKANLNVPRTLVLSQADIAVIVPQVEAIFLVRDLINTPTNDLGPEQLGDVLKQLADEHGALFEQWVGEELVADNFPAIHTVGRGSASLPRLLSLQWGNINHPRVTLVGKGVCFDSGGLDIKPSSGMRLMKKDMGGAAQVIGLSKWLMALKVPIRLTVLIPAVENAIDGEAYRPGDVITMRNGLTVEVHNTDAEGRLVLADALVKACEEDPEIVIDFATLTGAARVAVGTEISAMFTNDDQLAHDLTKAAEEVNDPIWRLPLFAGYNELFSSTIADLSNASESPYAGAITAALFLQRFVASHIPWVHFDIMAWNLSNKPGKPVGGEAMGILAVGQYLCDRYL